MEAVMSHQCLFPPKPTSSSSSVNNHNDDDYGESSCDVCGLLFYPLWTFFFPGNFFTASCSYITKNLMSPLEFRHRMDIVVTKMKYLRSRGRILTRLYPDVDKSDGYLGTGRYAAEHWIASHPNVKPCDMSPTSNLEYWWQNQNGSAAAPSLRWSSAPRNSMNDPSWFRLNHALLNEIVTAPPNNETVPRQNEYFLLPGFLFKWKELYGAAPPRNSWIWLWFERCDGSHWREMVEKYGLNRTVEVLLLGDENNEKTS